MDEAIQKWSRVVSANAPCRFDSSIGMLQLKFCSLADGGRACRLSCKTEGSKTLTIANLSESMPSARTNLVFKDDAEITCNGGDVLLVGALLPTFPRGVKRGVAGTKRKAAEVVPAPEEARAPSSPAKVATPKAAVAKMAPAKQQNGSGDMKALLKMAADASAGTASGRSKAEKSATPVSHRVLPSGLAYDVLQPGNGAIAGKARFVKVRYEGRLAKTNAVFDKGEIKFRLGLGEVIRAWDEGIQGMLVGEVRRLYVPSRLAYGATGAGKAIPPHADLLFEVELLQC